MRMGFTVPESQSQERLAAFTTRPGWDKIDAVKTIKSTAWIMAA